MCVRYSIVPGEWEGSNQIVLAVVSSESFTTTIIVVVVLTPQFVNKMTRNVMSIKEEFCSNGWTDLLSSEDIDSRKKRYTYGFTADRVTIYTDDNSKIYKWLGRQQW